VIRIGILGTARIARAFFNAPLQNAAIIAIASRELSKAEAFGAEFNIPRCYGSYDRLLSDPEIDAVYIPLPQHLHCEYTVKAAQAGKHVLVEKPAALSVAEVQAMISACQRNGVSLMEAFMYRFKAIIRRMKEVVASGEIGEMNLINFNWCFNIKQVVRSPFRLDRSLGGGAMYDLGIYGIDFVRFMTDTEPQLVSAAIRRETPDGVDMMAHVLYKSGDVLAACTSSLMTDSNHVLIGGTLGSISARAALAGNTVENILQVHHLKGDVLREERFPAENPYITELEYFARCIEHTERPFPDAENSLKNIRLIEQVFAKETEPMLM
jgi:D-xylose 1-dehydrogenase (NADP+, D-xylono-1,5-lactone-forming)